MLTPEIFNFMKLKIILFFIVLACFVSIRAQQVDSLDKTEELQKRLTQMEAEMKVMREELAKIKQDSALNKPVTQSISNDPTPAKTEPKQNQTVESAKQPKTTGVDLGSVRLTPYGTIYFNAFGNSGGTNNADVPLFATPTGSGNMSASVRQTRLGFRLEGAEVGKARLSAVLEADFFGGFPSVGIGENFGVVRLRLANAKLDWEKTSVTIGQDWMVFAPVNPISLAAAAIPQMAAAGNNWARLPQIKIERKLNKNFTFAGAILAPQTGDSATNTSFFLQSTSGSSSRLPFIQSRLSFGDNNWFGTKKAGSIGLSGQYGHSRIFTGSINVRNDIESVGIALDWNFPLLERVNLTGEAFLGRNLGGFQAGIFQSYNSDFAYRKGTGLVAGGSRSIGTRGGWTQVGFTPKVLQNRLGIYGSIGLDDPRDEDLVSLTHRDFRTRNLAIAGDLIYKFNPQFQIGAELRRFQTNYFFSGRQHSNHVNLSAAYNF